MLLRPTFLMSMLAGLGMLAVACTPTADRRAEPSASASDEAATGSSADDQAGDAARGEDDGRPAGDGAAGGSAAAPDDAELEIVDIIPMDAIPAIDDPGYWSIDEADEVYEEDTLVLGVSLNDEARAYHIPFLSRHEIVNDTVGGRPISVTW